MRSSVPHRCQRDWPCRPVRQGHAFTLLELLVVIGIIALVLAIVLPTTAGVRRSGKQVKCLSNLRQIGIAFVMYAGDNRGVLPDPSTDHASWESLLRPKLPGAVFECPADEELFPTVASSYDWRDTGDPTTTLAGEKLATAPPDCVLAFDALPGWHGKRKMNAVLVDGSGHFMTDTDCLENLGRAIRSAENAAIKKPKPKKDP